MRRLVDEVHAVLLHDRGLVLSVLRRGADVDVEEGGLLRGGVVVLQEEVGNGVLELLAVHRLGTEAGGALVALGGDGCGADVRQAAVLRGLGAAGVVGGHRADRGERLLAGLGVGLLVGAGVGLRVEGHQLELAAADAVRLARVEVGDVGLRGVLGRLEDARHRAADVGGVGDHDLVVRDAGLVLEAGAVDGLAAVAALPRRRSPPVVPPEVPPDVPPDGAAGRAARWCRRTCLPWCHQCPAGGVTGRAGRGPARAWRSGC